MSFSKYMNKKFFLYIFGIFIVSLIFLYFLSKDRKSSFFNKKSITISLVIVGTFLFGVYFKDKVVFPCKNIDINSQEVFTDSFLE